MKEMNLMDEILIDMNKIEDNEELYIFNIE